jgi:hypothetical protein
VVQVYTNEDDKLQCYDYYYTLETTDYTKDNYLFRIEVYSFIYSSTTDNTFLFALVDTGNYYYKIAIYKICSSEKGYFYN